MYTKTTDSITVTVEPTFLEDQSLPHDNHYVWAYQVWIENNGEMSVQILERSWKIIDARGQTHEVGGEGVVGERPLIHPGDSFGYTSGLPLGTPSGIMMGFYRAIDELGEELIIEIPPFSLDSPYQKIAFH